MVIFAGPSVKRSSNSQALEAMMASGSIMTRAGWDTLGGPTCNVACSRSAPVTATPASAYPASRPRHAGRG